MSNSLPRFFLERPATVGDCLALESAEAHHARVRRLASRDRVALFDGDGRSYIGSVTRVTSKRLEVRIDEELVRHANESPLHLTLAIAMLKSDRFEWMIEKVTELGVARIRPFTSDYSLAQPSAAKQARWQTIARSAAKQCGRSVVPHIDAPSAFAAIVTESAPDRILFWESATAPAVASDARGPTMLIIGPEGGFSDTEVEHARGAGCTIASLGPRILRAETAAVAAVTLAQAAWGDLTTLVPSRGSQVPA